MIGILNEWSMSDLNHFQFNSLTIYSWLSSLTGPVSERGATGAACQLIPSGSVAELILYNYKYN